ncbi:unnamed protein product [Paramecium sonneborni]|uniref:Uncharacterized protein n=1 Tax=Paramecium sonneborni TaxID=65129 RepID=A0A8S1R6W7_9CILI|nr:unnamed protein product [Paramecium sonneborni]
MQIISYYWKFLYYRWNQLYSSRTLQGYTEAGCYLGTDGTCILSFPIGQNTGNKRYRFKLCEVIDKGVNIFVCGGVILGKVCVSNTKNCILKQLVQYTKFQKHTMEKDQKEQIKFNIHFCLILPPIYSVELAKNAYNVKMQIKIDLVLGGKTFSILLKNVIIRQQQKSVITLKSTSLSIKLGDKKVPIILKNKLLIRSKINQESSQIYSVVCLHIQKVYIRCKYQLAGHELIRQKLE